MGSMRAFMGFMGLYGAVILEGSMYVCMEGVSDLARGRGHFKKLHPSLPEHSAGFNELHTSVNCSMSARLAVDRNIGALIIRTRFGGPLYYRCK